MKHTDRIKNENVGQWMHPQAINVMKKYFHHTMMEKAFELGNKVEKYPCLKDQKLYSFMDEVTSIADTICMEAVQLKEPKQSIEFIDSLLDSICAGLRDDGKNEPLEAKNKNLHLKYIPDKYLQADTNDATLLMLFEGLERIKESFNAALRVGIDRSNQVAAG